MEWASWIVLWVDGSLASVAPCRRIINNLFLLFLPFWITKVLFVCLFVSQFAGLQLVQFEEWQDRFGVIFRSLSRPTSMQDWEGERFYRQYEKNGFVLFFLPKYLAEHPSLVRRNHGCPNYVIQGRVGEREGGKEERKHMDWKKIRKERYITRKREGG